MANGDNGAPRVIGKGTLLPASVLVAAVMVSWTVARSVTQYTERVEARFRAIEETLAWAAADRFYRGEFTDWRDRLERRNQGKIDVPSVPYSGKYRPPENP